MNTDAKPVPTPLPTQTPEQAARLRALAEKQGVTGTANVEHLWGAGKDLWASDEEFEAFLAAIREVRAQKD
jgi:hypothetical protein